MKSNIFLKFPYELLCKLRKLPIECIPKQFNLTNIIKNTYGTLFNAFILLMKFCKQR